MEKALDILMNVKGAAESEAKLEGAGHSIDHMAERVKSSAPAANEAASAIHRLRDAHGRFVAAAKAGNAQVTAGIHQQAAAAQQAVHAVVESHAEAARAALSTAHAEHAIAAAAKAAAAEERKVGAEGKEAGEMAAEGAEHAERGFRALVARIRDAVLGVDFLKDAVEAFEAGTGVGAVLFLADQLREVFHAASEDQEALVQVRAALSLAGDASEAAGDRAGEFAEHLQKITSLSKGAILSGMSQLASEGKLTGENLNAATQAAIGLSNRLHVNLTTAFNLVSRAALGNTDILSRYGIVVDHNATAAQNFANIVKSGQDAMSLATAQTETFTGAWGSFKNRIDEVRVKMGSFIEGILPRLLNLASRGVATIEEFGEAANARITPAFEVAKRAIVGAFGAIRDKLAEAYDFAHPVLTELGHVVTTVGAVVVNVAVAAFHLLADEVKREWQNFKQLIPSLIAVAAHFGIVSDHAHALKDVFHELAVNAVIGLTTIEYAVENWKLTLIAAFAEAMYQHERLTNEAAYVFTTVIPAYLKYFWQFTKDTFAAAGHIAVQFFGNLANNAVNFAKALPKLLTGDKSALKNVWKPLIDEYSITLHAMPEIAKRQASPLENQFHKLADLAGNVWGDGLRQKLQTRLHELFGANEGEAKEHGERMGEKVAEGFKARFDPSKLNIPDAHLKAHVQATVDLHGTLAEAHKMFSGVQSTAASAAQGVRQQQLDAARGALTYLQQVAGGMKIVADAAKQGFIARARENAGGGAEAAATHGGSPRPSMASPEATEGRAASGGKSSEQLIAAVDRLAGELRSLRSDYFRNWDQYLERTADNTDPSQQPTIGATALA